MTILYTVYAAKEIASTAEYDTSLLCIAINAIGAMSDMSAIKNNTSMTTHASSCFFKGNFPR